VPIVLNSGNLNLLEPSGPVKVCFTGIALLLGQMYNLRGAEALGIQALGDILWLPWFLVEGYNSLVLNLNSNYSGSRTIFHYGEFCSFIVLDL
jgi:hypothetical protein